jgi:hypothetical protein
MFQKGQLQYLQMTSRAVGPWRHMVSLVRLQ